MRRIFVAVDLSAEARQRVSEYINDLKREFSDVRVGWEKSEKLHLTLKFLGAIDERTLTELEQGVRKTAAARHSFKLRIKDTGVFPNKKRARILWLGIEFEDESLSELKESLEQETERIGFEREKRRFHPHLTIGRLREPQRSTQLVEKHLEKKYEPVEFGVSEIVIYESELQPTGSIYKVVSKSGLI
jgi:RNA 2',3'-cyclic 3'-phosphodiesterase